MCPAETCCHSAPPSACLSLLLLFPTNAVVLVRKVSTLKQQPQKWPGKKQKNTHPLPPHYHQPGHRLSQSSRLLPARCSGVVSAPTADKTQFIYCQPCRANLAAFERAGFCSASRVNDNFQRRPCFKNLALVRVRGAPRARRISKHKGNSKRLGNRC